MAGRPKIQIDWVTVEKLALLQCTQEEIASFCKVSVDTLQNRKEFIGIYKKARDEGKMSLRRMMWKKANEGNTTMQIWLSKQYLGFTDKQEITGKDGAPLPLGETNVFNYNIGSEGIAEALKILVSAGAARLEDSNESSNQTDEVHSP